MGAMYAIDLDGEGNETFVAKVSVCFDSRYNAAVGHLVTNEIKPDLNDLQRVKSNKSTPFEIGTYRFIIK